MPHKKAILLAAYGASNFHSKECLRNFENLCRARFPGCPVRWAFTSLPIIKRLATQRQKSDSVRKALMRLYMEKFQIVAIQPLQTIPGREYEDVLKNAWEVEAETGMRCIAGKPLLYDQDSIKIAAEAIMGHIPAEREPGEDVVLMGHGAKHRAVSLYGELAKSLGELDSHIHLGTMSGARGLDEILPALVSERVWLMPLLSLIGRHAVYDMAGEGENSWRGRIEEKGHACLPILKGLAENKEISAIWLGHLKSVYEENQL